MKCNKLDDPEVIKSLVRTDCIGLMETHADKAVDFTLPGYYVFRKDKHKNAHILPQMKSVEGWLTTN